MPISVVRKNISLITGAGGLLGREHAHALLGLGHNVALTDIRASALGNLLAELSKLYPNQSIFALSLDVTSRESALVAARYLEGEGFDVDVLVNNAAYNPQPEELATDTRFEKFDLDQWDREFSIGLKGAVICCQVFGTKMAERGEGVILNIASDLSVIAPNQGLYRKIGLKDEEQPVKPVTYSVIKTGLLGLTRYLATYWAKNGVRVNALSPGGIENNQDTEFLQRIEGLIPLGRMAKRDELRGAVQFLCGPGSTYVTGQNLVVDGGRSVW
jgi:NAD(P)-dependent dehydrogenase (short-subunit alcohol dehydrogenase family)